MSDEEGREGRIARGVLNLILIVLVIVGWGIANLGPSDGGDSGPTRSVAWQRYDVAIDVRTDGTLHVSERQDVAFDGRFSQGYARIPLDRVERIDNVVITTEGAPVDRDQDGYLDSAERERGGTITRSREVPADAFTGEPGTHRVVEEGGELLIEYGFEPTGSPFSSFSYEPEERTIVLEYDVTGAIRDYPDAEQPWQQLHWMAISREVTDIADVRSASVTVTLPEAVPVEELAFAPEPEEVSETRLTWPVRSLDEGDAYDVQVAFPAITAATAPSWQPAADARDAATEDAENRQALAGVLLIGAGLLTLVGGGLGLLYAWYTRIREPLVTPAPDILAEPPGDLPAGLVGTLVDEEVHPRDVAALVMDLDRRGVVRIEESAPADGHRFGSQARYSLTLLRPIEAAEPHEQVVLRAIFGSGAREGATAGFDALRPLFGAYRAEIQAAMDAELVRRGYFAELPAESRATWRNVLRGFVGAGLLIAIVILLWTRSWTWFALLPPALALVVYVVGRRLTPSIARKTREGAEVAANWRAFQRHLESVQWATFTSERSAATERYLPWIIAFGLDHQWLRAMNTPATTYSSAPAVGRGGTSWTWGDMSGPRRASGTGSWSPSGGRGTFGDAAGWSGGSWDPGSWSDMQRGSDRALGALQRGSSSFFNMLGDAMEALGSSSGSGGGSGRRSFGGSSRSGGGRSRSSSGGGSRGFR